MSSELFDTTTREGKLLYLCLANMLTMPGHQGKTVEQLLAELDEGVRQLEGFKM